MSVTSKIGIVLMFSTLVVITHWSTPSNAANILVSMAFPFKTSHVSTMAAIVSPLARRGHNITLLRSSNLGTKGFTQESFSHAIVYNFNDQSTDFQAILKMVTDKNWSRLCFTGSDWEQMIGHLRFFKVGNLGCSDLFEDASALDLLRHSQFDVVIADVFDGCDMLVYGFLKGLNRNLQLVSLTTTTRYPLFNEHIFGMPMPSSYVPIGHSALTDKMTFTERVVSFLEHNILSPILIWVITSPLNKLKEKHGIYPEQDVVGTMREASLWLCVSDVALDFPRPRVPNWIPIGGIQNRPGKPLPEKFSDFVESSGDDGYILFSLGSVLAELPSEIAEIFALVFSELPQKVIWRYTGPRPNHLGNNTWLVDWQPQNDLLAHPKMRLLVYHGGINGVYEAVYHGVPMVIMPIFADQITIGAMVVSKGMGQVLDKRDITYDVVRSAVREVLENPSYAAQTKLYSNIHKHALSSPEEIAVFEIENVLKFGASHLRTRANELNFIQLNSLDVLLFLIFVTVTILYVLVKCFKFILRWCCKCCKTGNKDKRD